MLEPLAASRPPYGSRVRWGLLLRAPLLLAFIAWDCRDFSLVTVRQETTVYGDGALARVLTIEGVGQDGPPAEPDWLRSTTGVSLADPGAWSRVVEAPGRVEAEAVVPPGAQPPPSIQVRTPEGIETVHEITEVVRRDLVVAEIWHYRQVVLDPETPEPPGAALRRLADAVVPVLRSSLEREFGEDPAVPRAVRSLRAEVEPLLLEVFQPMVELLQRPSRAPEVLPELRGLLARHGFPPPQGLDARPTGGGEAFLLALDALLQAARDRVSVLLRRAGLSEAFPETLDFWPDASAIESFLEAPSPGNDPPVAGLHEALTQFVEHYLLAPDPEGFGRRWMELELRVRLPGVLLRTNGVPLDEPGAVVFVHRGLPGPGDAPFEAFSARLDDEALRAMGARREFARAEFVKLVDLLRKHDPLGALEQQLRQCVREGTLEPLLAWIPGEGESFRGDEVGVSARTLVELVRLLDPEIGGEP